ncbi:MAG TPA: glycosyltransferase family 4 protein [Acidimicrobiales bacterium]|nr:glycosyltransferase family 4 protein [Acidimicrobiales bacterium]
MIKIAMLKPHHGPVGGFERVVNRVEGILTGAGYDVTRHTVDLTDTDVVARSRRLESLVIDTQREFLTYLHGRDRFDGISSGVYDLVISTSPPSYVHRHRAHLALFFHHHRIFYDLEDTYVDAGFASDPEAHAHAARLVRDLDRDRLGAVSTFLCPSETVAGRLARFNGRRETLPFQAGIGVAAEGETVVDAGVAETVGVLGVTRHEFPKRAELLVAAAHLLDAKIPVTCTGTGGRLAFTRDLDARLSTREVTVEALDDAALWCNTGTPPERPVAMIGRVDFVGHVSDRRLDELYASARCVVAPAYDEDYGLTAIEAMHHGRPVIVCRDGGGLAELVDDGETGLVVEPTPAAIAAAVIRLHADDELATRLGRNGRARAAELSWSRAADQLLTAVEATLDTAA